MHAIAKTIMAGAEEVAAEGGDFETVLPILRKLSLDDFGWLLISMPSQEFPALSKILPPMASKEVQQTWTGGFGFDLLKLSSAFMKLVEVNCVRHRLKPLHDATVLDFGCGYGRMLRLLYYYTAPKNIWGVDAWERSLQNCYDAGLPGNFAQSDRTPKKLPVGDVKFDVAFSFSVFTHLAPLTANACLAAIRKSMKKGGLYITTVRPIEFWPYIDNARASSNAPRLMAEHTANGYAFLPHANEDGETYGDISMVPSYLAQKGWELLAYDGNFGDPFQVSVILKAV